MISAGCEEQMAEETEAGSVWEAEEGPAEDVLCPALCFLDGSFSNAAELRHIKVCQELHPAAASAAQN